MNKSEWNKLQDAIGNGTSNVVSVYGMPPLESTIGDMKRGDVGFTVPGAVENGMLDESFSIQAQAFGTGTLQVRCVKPHKYELDYYFVE